MLAAQNVLPREELRRTALLGELGLDGRVRPIRGVLPATLAAAQAGFTRVIVPLRQAGETHLVEGVEVLGVASISQLVALLRGDPVPEVEPIEVTGDPVAGRAGRQLDLADVVSQVEAKWACEVAAAGRHHMLFSGPPGGGQDHARGAGAEPAARSGPARRPRGVGAALLWPGSTSPTS